MLSNRKLWDWNSSGRGDIHDVIRRKFLAETNAEAVTIKTKLAIIGDIYSIAKMAADNLDCANAITGDTPDEYYIVGLHFGMPMFIFVHRDTIDDNDYGRPSTYRAKDNSANTIVELMLTGPHSGCLSVIVNLKKHIKQSEASVIRWWYKSSGGGSYLTREIFLDKPKTVLSDIIYPNLPCDPLAYMKEFMNSDQSVLLMAGDPGTGKTSFIRHLITEFKLNADVIYDEEAFKADYVFQNFLFDSASTVLIVEDADTVLKKRETEYNPLMSRFLNVTEGLINLPEKKLIFTTNLNDFTEVDPALIRPGRCFDIMRTRPYTYMEALQVCAFMNWPVPDHNKEYTVAELATNKSNPQQRKVGYK